MSQTATTIDYASQTWLDRKDTIDRIHQLTDTGLKQGETFHSC